MLTIENPVTDKKTSKKVLPVTKHQVSTKRLLKDSTSKGGAHKAQLEVSDVESLVSKYEEKQSEYLYLILDHLHRSLYGAMLDCYKYDITITGKTIDEFLKEYVMHMNTKTSAIRGRRFYVEKDEEAFEGSDAWVLINSALCLLISEVAKKDKVLANHAYESLYHDTMLKSSILFTNLSDSAYAISENIGKVNSILPSSVSAKDVDSFYEKFALHLIKVSFENKMTKAEVKALCVDNRTWAIYAYLENIVLSEILPTSNAGLLEGEYSANNEIFSKLKIGFLVVKTFQYLYLQGLKNKYNLGDYKF